MPTGGRRGATCRCRLREFRPESLACDDHFHCDDVDNQQYSADHHDGSSLHDHGADNNDGTRDDEYEYQHVDEYQHVYEHQLGPDDDERRGSFVDLCGEHVAVWSHAGRRHAGGCVQLHRIGELPGLDLPFHDRQRELPSRQCYPGSRMVGRLRAAGRRCERRGHQRQCERVGQRPQHQHRPDHHVRHAVDTVFQALRSMLICCEPD